MGTFDGVFVIKVIAQTAQFRTMGIVSGPSRHPKDAPFMNREWVLVGTYGLGATTYKPAKKPQISPKFQISILQNYKFQRHSPDMIASCLHIALMDTCQQIVYDVLLLRDATRATQCRFI